MNKIKDTEYLHATARIRALERDMLSRERLERMLDAKSDEEAARVPSECGYGDISSLSPDVLETALSNARRAVFELALKLCPDPSIVDVFRAKYDYHNLKVLLKSERNALPPASLIDTGRMSAAAMTEAVRNLQFSELPADMRAPAADAREILARTGDPQLSDRLLDSALLQLMLALSRKSNSSFLIYYVRTYIDTANLRAAVRATRLRREPDFMRAALSDGGFVDKFRLIDAVTAGTALSELYSGSTLSEAADAASRALNSDSSISDFERLCDDALIAALAPARRVAFGEQPLAAFIAAKEAEIVAIRIVLSGRNAGLAADTIRERLRVSYV